MPLSVNTACVNCSKHSTKLRAGLCPACFKKLLKGDKRHKFSASPTTVDGIKFQSKREASRYQKLLLAQRAGEVVFFIRQPRFDLPGPTFYYADFLVFWADRTVSIEDVKGHKTDTYKIKKRQVEALYPVKITEL